MELATERRSRSSTEREESSQNCAERGAPKRPEPPTSQRRRLTKGRKAASSNGRATIASKPTSEGAKATFTTTAFSRPDAHRVVSLANSISRALWLSSVAYVTETRIITAST